MNGETSSPAGPGPGPGGAWTRRATLRAGGMGLVAFGGRVGAAAEVGPAPGRESRVDGDERSVILISMVGGAGAAETFDPRPDAPSDRRGPFGSIASSVPGVRLVEHLPRLARRLDRVSLIRSLHHLADPTHADGLRILASGNADPLAPTLDARVATALGVRGGLPPAVVLPRPVGFVGAAPRRDESSAPRASGDEAFAVGGVPGSAGFDPGRLAGRLARWADRAAASGRPVAKDGGSIALGLADWDAAPARARARFGPTDFGRCCWLAARMVEAGVRFVTIPMATTVFGQPSWDAHGRSPWSTWDDYAGTLLPSFDAGVAALIDHLDAAGRLGSTLVVATGEMGRTPRINESGGRDHWPGAWSGLVAGGGTGGGRVVGAADDLGRIVDRPVPLAELVALMARHLGLGSLDIGPDGRDLATLLA